MTNVATTKPKFQFSAHALHLLTITPETYREYLKVLSIVRDNLYIYGIEGETTSKRLTCHERASALSLLDKVADLLGMAHKSGKKDLDNWAIYSCIGYVYDHKVDGKRFSDFDLIQLVFEVTTFWVWKVKGDIPAPQIVAPAVKLLDWFTGIAAAVQHDYGEYAQECN